MNPVVVVTANDIKEPVRGLIKGLDGLTLEISLMRPAGRYLLAQYPVLAGKSLSIRILSTHWHDTPLLTGTVVEATELADELLMKFELRDWSALADFWGHELRWLQHPSEPRH